MRKINITINRVTFIIQEIQWELNSTIMNKLPYMKIHDEDNDNLVVGERGNVINHLAFSIL